MWWLESLLKMLVNVAQEHRTKAFRRLAFGPAPVCGMSGETNKR